MRHKFLIVIVKNNR